MDQTTHSVNDDATVHDHRQETRPSFSSHPASVERYTSSGAPRPDDASIGATEGIGLTIARRFAVDAAGRACSPFDGVVWERRASTIAGPDGSLVFKMEGAEVPTGWSQLATDIIVSKYFRKASGGDDGDRVETSARQVVTRIARGIRIAGENYGGYFKTRDDAEAFEAELSYLMIHQFGAFDAPIWAHCGSFHEYGLASSGRGSRSSPDDAVPDTARTHERPRCASCFIQAVPEDSAAIYDLLKSEARLFEDGSGTGSNFSGIQGLREPGTRAEAGGLMSVLDVFDRAAGAKGGPGTTRRNAKLVCVDLDHPEIVDFIDWKVLEERKARALVGAGLGGDAPGGQNSRCSIRVDDAFMRAAKSGSTWQTIARTTGAVIDSYDAGELWRKIAEAAWHSGDPGLQYDSTINTWHTCPNTARINAANASAEYMFLDDSACTLGSLNLTKFLDESGAFDIEGFRHAAEIFFVAQEILVDLSAYPTRRLARTSHDYRPIGLGYANLGKLLALRGVPYDSDEGRATAAALTAILCGRAYRKSALMAECKGPFAGFARNREPMLRVMRRHQEAAYAINRDACPDELWRAAVSDWNDAVNLGERFGYRNAQATVLASAGTIGLMMDCSTTGIDPACGLIEFKKVAGGGHEKTLDDSLTVGLRRLGYSPAAVQEIVAYVAGTNTLLGAPDVNRASLLEKGLTDEEVREAERALLGVSDLRLAFAPWVIGKVAYDRLGVTAELLAQPGFDLLEHLGFTRPEVERANDHILGRMTIEGAPGLAEEDYGVFDCSNRCGRHGRRFLPAMAHVRMMAAVQPFLSGATSKTVHLPNYSTVNDVREIYEEGWRLGLKALALYREGCRASVGASWPRTEAVASEGSEAVPRGARDASPGPRPSVPPVGTRVPLPSKRVGFTQEARIGGQAVVLRTGEFEDGSLGEILIDTHEGDAAFRSLLDCFATAVSVGLQYGVPLDTYVEQFTSTRFDPRGPLVGDPNVEFATSIVDYVFRVLGVEYQRRHDRAPAGAAEVGLASSPRLPDSSDTLDAGRSSGDGAGPASPARSAAVEAATRALEARLDEVLGEAPLCDGCGHVAVRSGGCYKCLNCGSSMGCC